MIRPVYIYIRKLTGYLIRALYCCKVPHFKIFPDVRIVLESLWLRFGVLIIIVSIQVGGKYLSSRLRSMRRFVGIYQGVILSN